MLLRCRQFGMEPQQNSIVDQMSWSCAWPLNWVVICHRLQEASLCCTHCWRQWHELLCAITSVKAEAFFSLPTWQEVPPSSCVCLHLWLCRQMSVDAFIPVGPKGTFCHCNCCPWRTTQTALVSKNICHLYLLYVELLTVL